jgi:hypothetical protein
MDRGDDEDEETIRDHGGNESDQKCGQNMRKDWVWLSFKCCLFALYLCCLFVLYLSTPIITDSTSATS